MSGIRALRKLQLGLETTAGTAAVATTIWRGMGTVTDITNPVVAEEDIGSMLPQPRVYFPIQGAQVEFDEVEATFEQLPYILEAGIKTVTTGVADSTGSGKVYSYPISTTAQNTFTTYTLQGGDNQRVDLVDYAFVTKFSISGAKGEAVKMSASWTGQAATDGDFTTSIAVPTIESILFQKGKLYLDPTTAGTTQKTTTWLGTKIAVETGIAPIYTGDGTLTFSTAAVITPPKVTGELVLRHDTTGEAELGFARLGTVRLLRQEFQGSTLTTAGVYTTKTLRFQAAILYDEIPSIDEQDGNDIVTLKWHAVDSGSLIPTFTVVNSLTALT